MLGKIEEKDKEEKNIKEKEEGMNYDTMKKDKNERGSYS